jgi:glycosyltransferase involved in cell wall biosynthesis
MNNTPLISVLMPVYNAESYLKDSIQSILNQSLNDFEFIIINDCSTDRSGEIIKSFSDNRIRYFENTENLKLIQCLNFGISVANGKYIARMDADDISMPNRFQKQFEVMENNPKIDICGTSIQYFNESERLKKWIVPEKDHNIKLKMLFGSQFAHPTVFIKKSFLDKHKLVYSDNALHVEDYEFWIRCCGLGAYFYNITDVMLLYRKSENSVSHKYKYLQQKNNLLCQKKYFESFIERNISENECEFQKNSSKSDSYSDKYVPRCIAMIREICKINEKKNIYSQDDLIIHLCNLFFRNIRFVFKIRQIYTVTKNIDILLPYIKNRVKKKI